MPGGNPLNRPAGYPFWPRARVPKTFPVPGARFTDRIRGGHLLEQDPWLMESPEGLAEVGPSVVYAPD